MWNQRRNSLSKLFSLILTFIVQKCHSQGFDAGPADPLGFGQIDPTSLEIAATYVFIVPMVIFLVGILAIPAALVITFLIAQPLIIPPDVVGVKRRKRSMNIIGNESTLQQSLIDHAMSFLSKSQCINRIICEMDQRNHPDSFKTESHRKKRSTSSVTASISRTRKVFNRYNCSDQFQCKAFDFFISVGNVAFRMLNK